MTRGALRSKLFLAVSLLMAVLVIPARPASRQSGLSSIKTVFVILFENTNWASITPSVAPYIRTTVVPTGAHATQYFNPPRRITSGSRRAIIWASPRTMTPVRRTPPPPSII